MRPVVADTGPLNYLILIESVDVLPRLFSSILIPPKKHQDFLCFLAGAAGARRTGRSWPAARASRARKRSSSSVEVKRRWRERLRRKSSAAISPLRELHSAQQETRLQ